MTESEYRAKLKANHICRDCKQTDAYTLAGRTYCAECARKWQIAKKKKDRNPEKNTTQKWQNTGKSLQKKNGAADGERSCLMVGKGNYALSA